MVVHCDRRVGAMLAHSNCADCAESLAGHDRFSEQIIFLEDGIEQRVQLLRLVCASTYREDRKRKRVGIQMQLPTKSLTSPQPPTPISIAGFGDRGELHPAQPAVLAFVTKIFPYTPAKEVSAATGTVQLTHPECSPDS